jgi:predicted aminopeptidase
MAERPINNARLIGVLIYRTHLDWFEQWHEREGQDIRRAIASLRTLLEGAEGDSAFARLQRSLASR